MSSTDTEQTTTVARVLVAARAAGGGLSGYPGELPSDAAAAYAVQDAAISLWDGEIVGWKIGFIKPDRRAADGVDRLVGPIWRAQVIEGADADPTSEHPIEIFTTGFAAAEAEFIVQLGEDLPVGKENWTAAEVAEVPSTVRIGFEVASSPIPEINDLGPLAVMSDFGNNNGLLIGSEITGAIDAVAITTRIDDQVVGTGSVQDIPEGIHTAIAHALEVLAKRGIWIKAGTIFATGAITGIHPMSLGQQAVVEFAPIGQISTRAVSAPAHTA